MTRMIGLQLNQLQLIHKMKFLDPSPEILKILNPDDFIKWQKESFFAYAYLYESYHMQVIDQCNFATAWGLYRLAAKGHKGFFAWGEFRKQQHSWIILDNLYYDLTLQQFNCIYPKLAVTKPSNKNYKTIEIHHVNSVVMSFDKWKIGDWLEKTFSKYCEDIIAPNVQGSDTTDGDSKDSAH